jgi:hypothetical protein
MTKRIVAGSASPEDWQKAEMWLTLWRDNDKKLAPTLPKSELTAELVPASQTLQTVATIGLEALASLKNGTALPADRQKQNLAVLTAAEKPQSELLVMVAPSVELLEKAVKTQ